MGRNGIGGRIGRGTEVKGLKGTSKRQNSMGRNGGTEDVGSEGMEGSVGKRMRRENGKEGRKMMKTRTGEGKKS